MQRASAANLTAQSRVDNEPDQVEDLGHGNRGSHRLKINTWHRTILKQCGTEKRKRTPPASRIATGHFVKLVRLSLVAAPASV